MTQGKRYDSEGEYVRRYVPELARMPSKYIHRPWETPPQLLAEAGVSLGKNYPLPVVDHALARARFLELAKRSLRGRKAPDER
jgi:deoxyribodipyrimidine photo-lyase